MGRVRVRNESLSPAEAERSERLKRAGLIAFSLQAVQPEDPGEESCAAVVWVTETVPRHGSRGASLGVVRVPDGGRNDPDWLDVAERIVSHLVASELLPSSRLCWAAMLAIEVLPALPVGWQLTGRQVIEYTCRERSGAELVQTVRAGRE